MKKLLFIFPFILISSCEQKPLDATYDGGDHLVMTQRNRTSLDYKLTFNLSIPLHSIYWNPSNNQYYYVKDGSDLTKTNGLVYKLDPKKEEEVFVQDIKDPYLRYAGYISSNQRLYIDRRNRQQYIKTLIPIKDPVEVIPYKNTLSDGRYLNTLYEDIHHNEKFARSGLLGEL